MIVRVLAAALFISGAAAIVAAEVKTITGEVVDVQCYVKDGRKATGEDHGGCARTCAGKGGPMGILASDGLYGITGEFAANRNRKLLPFVAQKVQATGEIGAKDGKKTIKLSALEKAK